MRHSPEEERGGRLVACTPCVKARGHTRDDLIEGTEIAGSSVAAAALWMISRRQGLAMAWREPEGRA